MKCRGHCKENFTNLVLTQIAKIVQSLCKQNILDTRFYRWKLCLEKPGILQSLVEEITWFQRLVCYFCLHVFHFRRYMYKISCVLILNSICSPNAKIISSKFRYSAIFFCVLVLYRSGHMASESGINFSTPHIFRNIWGGGWRFCF